MKELVKTNDMVLISFVEALLKEEGIHYFIFDQNMSILDGSLGILPRRIMIKQDDEARARTLLKQAGIDHELRE